jgi:hypothetical protein
MHKDKSSHSCRDEIHEIDCKVYIKNCKRNKGILNAVKTGFSLNKLLGCCGEMDVESQTSQVTDERQPVKDGC